MAPQRMPAKNNHAEMVGRKVSLAKIVAEIEKDIIFYDDSGGGVTFSGGEPLMQPRFLADLLHACQEREIHTVVDTSGAAPRQAFKTIVDRCDLFLFDLKIMDNKEHRCSVGASNREILANLDFLAGRAKAVWVRFPLIPGITAGNDNIMQMARWMAKRRGIQALDILPYHNIAAEKYRRLGLVNRMNGIRPPSPEGIASVRRQFEAHGIHTTIGG